MLQSLIKPPLVYIKIFENKIEVRRCDQSNTTYSLSAPEPFTSSRCLIGNFNIAESLIKTAFTDVLDQKLFAPSPIGLIHGVDKSEGGYSEVEERVLRELGYGSGCRKVYIWHGRELSNQEVRQHTNYE